MLRDFLRRRTRRALPPRPAATFELEVKCEGLWGSVGRPDSHRYNKGERLHYFGWHDHYVPGTITAMRLRFLTGDVQPLAPSGLPLTLTPMDYFSIELPIVVRPEPAP